MKVEVLTPLAVTSFFQYVEVEGRPGARGGGFIPSSRMRTVVSAGSGRVTINGVEERETTTHMALRMFRPGIEYKVDVQHDTSPFPIATGFGTSGSGSWGAVIGASFVLGGTKDYFELAWYAHQAEIEKKTGLGTVASISASPTGAGMLLEPGPPGRAVIKPIIFEEDRYRLIFVIFGGRKTSSILSSPSVLKKLSEAGEKAMDMAVKECNLEGLLSASRFFAERCGIVERDLLRLCRRIEELGALGAAPNMIGNAVHAVVPAEKAGWMLGILRREYDAQVLMDGFGRGGATVKHLN